MVKKIMLGVFVVVVLGIAAAYIVRNILVERAVEVGSEYALGVKTDLGSASLELTGASLELNDLEIYNPEGFEGKNFMSLRRGVLDVDAGSVLDDEVVVDSFIIEGVRLHFEHGTS